MQVGVRFRLLAPILGITIALSGCPADPGTPADAGGPAVSGPIEPPAAKAEPLWSVSEPTQVVPVPGTDAVVVLEREGRVVLLGDGPRATLLNITDRIDTRGERGLVSFAFHPDFSDNGMLFLAYSDTSNAKRREGYSELVRYQADPDDIRASWERQDVLLRFEWTNWFHNMGDLKFGPDGMLYVSLGDGSRDRPDAQDLARLNGSILRLDVDGPTGYEIPPDNPFVGDTDARGEIWLYGLRNPWRIDFNPENGDLFIGASGETAVEAVYRFPGDGDAPRNHGWPFLEGDQPFEDYGEPPGDVNLPIAQYERPTESGACAVIGGNVYEGEDFPGLRGKFVFGDHCSGELMFTQETASGWEMKTWVEVEGEYLYSVDADADGEIVVSTYSGQLYRIEPA